MADESNDGEGNEDSWLYGNSDPKPPGIAEDEVADQPVDELNTEKSNNEQQEETTNPEVEDEHDGNDDPTRAADEMEEQEDDGVANQGNGEMDSDESDDDINVVIGDIKSGPNYNIKVYKLFIKLYRLIKIVHFRLATGNFSCTNGANTRQAKTTHWKIQYRRI